MTTYCQICRGEISPERVAKKARTCGDECQKQYRAQMRSERAEKKCRLCGRPFRQRRSTEGVLHEHNDVVDVVTLPIQTCASDGDYLRPVSAALTSEGQQLTNVKALVVVCGNCGKPNNLCNTKNFTVSGTLENEVESLLTVGAELPVFGDEQAVNMKSTGVSVETVEMSQNEGC